MRELLAACALLLVVAQAAVPNRVVRSVGHHDGHKCNCNWRGGAPWESDAMVEGRLEGQAARLEKLQAKLDALQAKADDKVAKADGLIKQFKTVKARVHKLEGSECAIDEFECGGVAHMCVNEYHMCDGTKDCYNGADEESDNCQNHMHAGAVFEGNIHNQDDCTKRKPYKLRTVVTSVSTKSWFPSVPKTRVSVLLYYRTASEDRVDTLDGTGTWDYAHHRMVVHALEADGLGLYCKFDGVNDDHCDAHIYNENSNKDCVQFTMHRVNH